MLCGVIKPFLEDKFPGGNTHPTLAFEQGRFQLRGAWWPWCQGRSRIVLCISTSATACESLEAPEPHVLRVGLGGASLQLAQGQYRKNKLCRKKKKTIKKKEKCAVIFIKPASYCRFGSAWKGQCSHSTATHVVASLG